MPSCTCGRDVGTACKEATEEWGDSLEGDKGHWGGQEGLRKWGGERIPWACELVNVRRVGEVRSADTEGAGWGRGAKEIADLVRACLLLVELEV